MQIYMNNQRYNITSTAITASQLNVETSVNREPHCDGPWFQPTDKVLHYVDLLCYADTSAPEQRTELLVGGHILLHSGGECSSECLFGLDYSVSLR